MVGAMIKRLPRKAELVRRIATLEAKLGHVESRQTSYVHELSGLRSTVNQKANEFVVSALSYDVNEERKLMKGILEGMGVQVERKNGFIVWFIPKHLRARGKKVDIMKMYAAAKQKGKL